MGTFGQFTGWPKKHGNSVTNSISSLLWTSIVIPNFKSHNIIMSARVYFMKRVKDFTMSLLCLRKMYSDGGQFTLFVYCNFLVLLKSTTKENWIQGGGNRVYVHFAVTFLDCWRTSFCVTTITKAADLM